MSSRVQLTELQERWRGACAYNTRGCSERHVLAKSNAGVITLQYWPVPSCSRGCLSRESWPKIRPILERKRMQSNIAHIQIIQSPSPGCLRNSSRGIAI